MLTVSLATVDVDSALAEKHGMEHRGRCVRLSVADTGEGIPEELQSKIFDPFFTTKDPNRGTGLGLSTVFGIVHQHGGMITFESWERVGMRFDVYFPVSTTDAPMSGIAFSDAPEGGSETVLLVDDDYRVRDVGATILKNAGYNVLMAEDGERAVDVFGEHAGEIDVVLLDVMMPGLNGQEVANRIRGVRPEVPIVFCSGYSPDMLNEKKDGDVGAGFIQKPYSRSKLLESLRQELGPESSEPSPTAD